MSAVRDFEQAFAEYVGAKYAVALCNGTATLHTALVALGVKPGDRVAVPPLTMASTTIAVLHAGAVPVFVDVDPETWLMRPGQDESSWAVPVSLYGLHLRGFIGRWIVNDAAQTLMPHLGGYEGHGFTSYSFQASKILALGEGGALATDDEILANNARSFSSLGYKMYTPGPEILKVHLKNPTYERHHSLGWNYRMADAVADLAWDTVNHGGLVPWHFGLLLEPRRQAATLYRDAIAAAPWITPQHVPDGWTHDYWTYAVALESADLWHPFVDAIERNGGERPYAAWRITYQEPAFRHLAEDGTCPVAEDLQPRLVQFQTNRLDDAKRNADAVSKAIREVGG